MAPTTTPISCAAEAAAVLAPAIPRRLRRTQECFLVLLLDAKHRMLGKPVVVAIGTATAVEVHPRDVFREAVRRNAVAVIVAHNHPSGDASASRNDRELTSRLKEAAHILGIPLLDHLILTGDAWVSLAESGLI